MRPVRAAVAARLGPTTRFFLFPFYAEDAAEISSDYPIIWLCLCLSIILFTLKR